MVSVFGLLRRGAVCVVALALSLPALAAQPAHYVLGDVSAKTPGQVQPGLLLIELQEGVGLDWLGLLHELLLALLASLPAQARGSALLGSDPQPSLLLDVQARPLQLNAAMLKLLGERPLPAALELLPALLFSGVPPLQALGTNHQVAPIGSSFCSRASSAGSRSPRWAKPRAKAFAARCSSSCSRRRASAMRRPSADSAALRACVSTRP